MTKPKRVREAALEILESVDKKGAYSNLLLNHVINNYRFSDLDAGLLTEITYGTLQRKLTLDYYLKPFIKKPKKIDPWIMHLLRLSVYQLAFLTKIPDHAIIHEAVEIAKNRGHRGIAGLVNGVLRAIQREGIPSTEGIKDPVEKLSVETSHPKWLIKRWIRQYGFEKTRAMCEENLIAPKQSARVNEWKSSVEEVIQRLAEEGIEAVKSRHIPGALKATSGNMASSSAFQKGILSIQDESSMIVGYAVDPRESERILDACSAPGGKATHMGERMKNTGRIIALDLHPHKLGLIKENSRRLGLTNIETVLSDAREAGGKFPQGTFDRVLVDAPCSGLGVIRRKPDIKYTKGEEDIRRLAIIQREILNEASKLVKKGGLLVYSTCTVDKEENEETASHFLETHPEFEGDETLRNRVPEAVKPFVIGNRMELLPQDLQSDGFFIACFKKKV